MIFVGLRAVRSSDLLPGPYKETERTCAGIIIKPLQFFFQKFVSSSFVREKNLCVDDNNRKIQIHKQTPKLLTHFTSNFEYTVDIF